MADHVTTFLPRVTFVEKTSSEVGDGTLFPMLVTLDQLAEIIYRVKDAVFTAGSIGYDYEIDYPWEDPPRTEQGTAGTVFLNTPASALVAYYERGDYFNGSQYSYARGFVASRFTGDPDPIPPSLSAFFGEEYTTNFNEVNRDCLKEFGIWCPDYGILGSPGTFVGNQTRFRCGFSHYAASFGSGYLVDPTLQYTIAATYQLDGEEINYQSASIKVSFDGNVAYIGNNPMDPDAQLYIGIEMLVGGPRQAATNTSYGNPIDSGARFILKLANDHEVSCAIYKGDDSETDTTVISDFVLQATEWWPYQDENGNVWSPTTGLPV